MSCEDPIRAGFNGTTIAESTRALRVLETGHAPVIYFPHDDVRMECLQRSDHTTFCPFKGDASYWTLRVGDRSAADAVWSYEDPFDEVAEIAGYLAFYRDRLDDWLDQNERP